MLAESGLLSPERRTLYSDSLRPPHGYVFDAGVATTFSLNLETLLTIPVYLALYSAPTTDEVLASSIAILEAIERTSKKLAIFVQGGRMQAVDRQPRLCSLLEPVAIDVSAPLGGTFHPKLWALRYRPRDHEDGQPLLRLLVLSRNLTNDRSWDVALRVEGQPGRRGVSANRPLSELLSALPDFAVRSDQATSRVRKLTQDLADEVQRTVWDLPVGLEELAFETVGLSRRKWSIPKSKQLGVISPFCDDRALELIAQGTEEAAILVSRQETLDALSSKTRARFKRVCVLQETAESEDGEDRDQDQLHGLHAKIYALDQGWNTTLVVGSGNATTRVFGRADNVELFALLTGRRSDVGDVAKLFDADNFGKLLTDFVASETDGISAAEQQADKDLDEARIVFLRAGLKVTCAAERSDANESTNNSGGSWRMSLAADGPIPVQGIRSVSVWPVILPRSLPSA
jgi:hypothetical protein